MGAAGSQRKLRPTAGKRNQLLVVPIFISAYVVVLNKIDNHFRPTLIYQSSEAFKFHSLSSLCAGKTHHHEKCLGRDAVKLRWMAYRSTQTTREMAEPRPGELRWMAHRSAQTTREMAGDGQVKELIFRMPPNTTLNNQLSGPIYVACGVIKAGDQDTIKP